MRTRDHYDHLIEQGNDPFWDPRVLTEYMNQWTGPEFWNLLGDLGGKSVLEIGVGTGRLALECVRRGCASFVGIDISPKTLMAAERNLAEHSDTVTFLEVDVLDLELAEDFDCVYSVLTFMHVERKAEAIAAIARHVAEGGISVLSLAECQPVLHFDDYVLTLYPNDLEEISQAFGDAGMHVDQIKRLDGSDGKVIAQLLKATKGIS